MIYWGTWKGKRWGKAGLGLASPQRSRNCWPTRHHRALSFAFKDSVCATCTSSGSPITGGSSCTPPQFGCCVFERFLPHFSPTDQAEHINIQEIRAMLETPESFPNVRFPGVVRVRIVSMANVHVLNTMRLRLPALMDVVRELHKELHSRQLRARA